MSNTFRCKWCGVSLAQNHIGPCPSCGKAGKEGTIILDEKINMKDSMNWERRKEFFEENPKIKLLVIAITIASPIIGLFLAKIWGFIGGLGFGALTYWLSPSAIIKIREIERG